MELLDNKINVVTRNVGSERTERDFLGLEDEIESLGTKRSALGPEAPRVGLFLFQRCQALRKTFQRVLTRLLLGMVQERHLPKQQNMVWLATIVYWISLSKAEDFEEIEKCYSCSSATFSHRWPRTQNSTYLFITNVPIVANESCDNMKSALPVVPCPDSVCVKFVLVETSANRAVCSALQSPIIVRDCWSRILHSDDPDLQLRPLEDKPVPLIGLAESDRTIGAVYTCNGYLCNSASLTGVKQNVVLIILLIMIACRVK